MALNFPPMAYIALRYGAVAVAGFAAARYAPRGRLPSSVEAEMDIVKDGLQMRRAPGQLSATGKVTKNWRAGRFGPRFRIDATALARFRIRRLT